MDCLAADLVNASGLTEVTSVVPVTLACSTSAFVVALSITSFAASAFALASALALVFSSAVNHHSHLLHLLLLLMHHLLPVWLLVF